MSRIVGSSWDLLVRALSTFIAGDLGHCRSDAPVRGQEDWICWVKLLANNWESESVHTTSWIPRVWVISEASWSAKASAWWGSCACWWWCLNYLHIEIYAMPRLLHQTTGNFYFLRAPVNYRSIQYSDSAAAASVRWFPITLVANCQAFA
jgi:hypothetical protein